MIVKLIALYLTVTSAFTIYGAPGATAPLYCDTYLVRGQWGGNVDSTAFGRNYSIVYASDPFGCDSSTFPPLDRNTLLWIRTNGIKPCDQTGAQRNVAEAGGGGIFAAHLLTAAVALFNSVAQPPIPSSVPLAWCNTPGDPFVAFNDARPFSFRIPSWLNAGENITIQYDFPVRQPLWDLVAISASAYQFLTWSGFILSLFLMLMCAMKYAVFWFAEEKINPFRIPQLVLMCCFFAGMWNLMQCLWGPWAIYGTGDSEAEQFFAFFSSTWMFTALIVMGLYFKEISQLTSSRSVPSLGYFFIPAIVMIVIMWGATIASGALNVREPDTNQAVGASSDFYIAIGSIVCAVVLFIIAWGSVNLILSLRSSSSGSGTNTTNLVLRVILLSSLSAVIAITCSMYLYAIRLYPTTAFGYGTSYDWVCAILGITSWGINISGILLSLIFRVQLQKEIDVSKSATSSTSSASAASSSSSSSSSMSTDPVIEL